MTILQDREHMGVLTVAAGEVFSTGKILTELWCEMSAVKVVETPPEIYTMLGGITNKSPMENSHSWWIPSKRWMFPWLCYFTGV